MSKDMNNYSCTGRLGRDISLRQAGEHMVAEGVVAISDEFGDGEDTVWLPIVIWGKRGESAAQYLRKGSRVGLEGSLAFDKWEQKSDNQKRNKHFLKVNNWYFLDPKPDESGRPAQNYDSNPPGRPGGGEQTPMREPNNEGLTTKNVHDIHGAGAKDDDDIPF